MKKELLAASLTSFLAGSAVGLAAGEGVKSTPHIEQKMLPAQRRDAGSLQYPNRVGERLCELELLKQGVTPEEACE